MYIRSLKKDKNNTGPAKGAARPQGTAPPTDIWSAVALQRHHAQLAGMTASSGQAGRAHPSRREFSAAVAVGVKDVLPPEPSTQEWSGIVAEAGVRATAVQGPRDHACAICMERFISSAAAPQVILSCSHVFHKVCIAQLEKFVRRAGETPSCPLCRAAHYHKRPLAEGREQTRALAATQIQAAIRGYLQRRRYFRLRLRSNKTFRTECAYEQLCRLSNAYLAAATAREKRVDEVLEAMDVQRQQALANAMSTRDWDALRRKVLERAMDGEASEGVDCPICMAAVVDTVTGEVAGGAVLLSCSHTFHASCLESFERLAGKGVAPRCAVCRSAYAQQPLLS